MVDKEVLDWVKTEIGKSIHPYDNDASLTDEEALDELERYMKDFDFSEASKVLLHGSPSQNENELRYTLFEKAALYLQNTGHHEPDFYAHTAFESMIKDSKFLNTEDVNFIEADITEDELNAIYNPSMTPRSFNKLRNKKNKQKLENGITLDSIEKRIHITSDYHVEGVDSLNNHFDLADYLVLSADTSGEDFPPKAYTEILGPLRPLSSALTQLGVSWRTWAEGKEAGRKVMDGHRGPRF